MTSRLESLEAKLANVDCPRDIVVGYYIFGSIVVVTSVSIALFIIEGCTPGLLGLVILGAMFSFISFAYAYANQSYRRDLWREHRHDLRWIAEHRSRWLNVDHAKIIAKRRRLEREIALEKERLEFVVYKAAAKAEVIQAQAAEFFAKVST